MIILHRSELCEIIMLNILNLVGFHAQIINWNGVSKKFLYCFFPHRLHYIHLYSIQNASEISWRTKCCSNFLTNFQRPRSNIRTKFRKPSRDFVRKCFKSKKNFTKFRIRGKNRHSISRQKFIKKAISFSGSTTSIHLAYFNSFLNWSELQEMTTFFKSTLSTGICTGQLTLG